jgi:hypothetical protein
VILTVFLLVREERGERREWTAALGLLQATFA